MGLLLYLILLAVAGFVIGGLARFALPGPDPMTVWQTIAVGIGGSLIAGILVRVIFGEHYGAGFLASFTCSVGIVYAVRRSRGGGLTDPGHPPLRR